MSENFDFMHLTARKMIFNANYEEKLTGSFQNKRNWVQLGFNWATSTFSKRLRRVEKCREMSRNVEKCREMSRICREMSRNVEFLLPGHLRHVEKCREMSRNVEFCRSR